MTPRLRPSDESGTTMTEYILILAPLVTFVALAVLAIVMSGQP